MNTVNTNIINNPLTFYRLDPGEPGLAPPTPASQSTFTVFSQEARNRQRLKTEAMMEGKEVIFLNTEYKLRKNGSFLTMVGGTTTIVTRENKEEKKNSTLNFQDKEQKVNPIKDNYSSELKIKERLLKTEQKILEAKLRTVEEFEKIKIEKRLKEIEIELKKIEKLKQEEKNPEEMNPSYGNAVQSLLETLNDPAGLIIDLMI